MRLSLGTSWKRSSLHGIISPFFPVSLGVPFWLFLCMFSLQISFLNFQVQLRFYMDIQDANVEWKKFRESLENFGRVYRNQCLPACSIILKTAEFQMFLKTFISWRSLFIVWRPCKRGKRISAILWKSLMNVFWKRKGVQFLEGVSGFYLD